MTQARLNEFLTVGQAAELLGVSPWTLRNWDKSGKLTTSRHPQNGYRIYRREDLEAWRTYAGSLGEVEDRSAHTPEPREVGDNDHFVQFYESDEFLAQAVAGYIGTAFAAGDTGLIVATPPHRETIEKLLAARGFDVAALRASGRYVALDAAETLAAFMQQGRPDAVRFRQTVGEAIQSLAERGGRIRAFGEMVALLWAEGNEAGAIRLEELWNELAKTRAFALLCAYPLHGFSGRAASDAFASVCGCHHRVVPAESYSDLANDDERLLSISRLQQKAQALEAEIAHRVRVEKALAERESELNDFLENATEGLHRVGPDGTILWANRAEMAMLGYEPHEYIGRSIADFHADEDAIGDILDKLKRGETLRDRPATLRCKDGRLKDVLISSNSYFRDGQFIHSRCFTHDVTDTKRVDRANALLAAIVDSSDDAIVSKDLNGVIMSWNRGAERIFGYPAEEAVGRHILFLLPPERQDEEKLILSRLRRGERVDHFETVRVTKDGRPVHVSLTISPVRDASGRIIGASKIARDITERKRGEEMLREMNATLERRVAERTAALEAQSEELRELAAELNLTEQRERRKLAGVLHDDLAQSLALTKLKLTMLEAQRPEARSDVTLQSIKDSLTQAIQFTRTLMSDLSPPMLYDLGFSAAVQELAGRLQEQHGLRVEVQASGKVSLAEDLRTFLFQAVREMLTNVIKYGSTDRARVTIDKTPERVSVVVEDEGAGFDLATLPDRPADHRGFGLFNIRERTRLLGGAFTVESSPGRGTCCRLEVPTRTTEDDKVAAADRPGGARASGNAP